MIFIKTGETVYDSVVSSDIFGTPVPYATFDITVLRNGVVYTGFSGTYSGQTDYSGLTFTKTSSATQPTYTFTISENSFLGDGEISANTIANSTTIEFSGFVSTYQVYTALTSYTSFTGLNISLSTGSTLSAITNGDSFSLIVDDLEPTTVISGITVTMNLVDVDTATYSYYWSASTTGDYQFIFDNLNTGFIYQSDVYSVRNTNLLNIYIGI